MDAPDRLELNAVLDAVAPREDYLQVGERIAPAAAN